MVDTDFALEPGLVAHRAPRDVWHGWEESSCLPTLPKTTVKSRTVSRWQRPLQAHPASTRSPQLSTERPAGRCVVLHSSPVLLQGSLAQCSPEQFHCSEPRDPQTDCYPLEWLCDGHPDCDDGRDEWGCGASGSPAVPTAGGTETSAVPVPGRALPSRNHGRMWMLIVAVLLSCLVAVGGIAAWGKSKAKSRSDIFGLESVSREQLVPDKSQADLFS
ncbi:CD320 antigen isoform X1 [Gallus gallus]|uniref:CD320 antigen isoform X1 n=1 Tax=Gallus gallus TaxID=9031 RepID=UPI001F00E82F|nr:CD320 antigen isoform X1 [Gallus gallus]XP_046789709.1 CD320 antigen isoform X1 [Gallus gallus]